MSFRHYLAISLLCLGAVHAAPSAMLSPKEENVDIEINNRILAVVNGKPISVIDVMKRMDLLFYRQYPEYAASKQARFQYYDVSWKPVLSDLIDKELIQADATELKLEINPSEIRQELESLFGPNIIFNLDKIDMSLDEAMKLLKSELVIRRTMAFRVNVKAFRQIGPQEVRGAYELWAKENMTPERWRYRLITVRDTKAENAAQSALMIYEQFSEQGHGWDDVKAQVENKKNYVPTSTVTFSELLETPRKEIAANFLEVMEELGPGSYSKPVVQKSRSDQKSTVVRIFFVEDKLAASAPPLKEVEVQLKNKLFQDAMEREGKSYIDNLHDRFKVNVAAILAAIPGDFKPFILHEKQ